MIFPCKYIDKEMDFDKMVWTTKVSLDSNHSKKIVRDEVAVDESLARGRGGVRRLGVAVAGISCLCLTEGLHGRYLSSILTTIERRFQFSSEEMGVLFSLADITVLASIIFTTYAGSLIHKARALSACALIFTSAHVMWSLPYFIFPMADVRIETNSNNATGFIISGDQCNGTTSYDDCGDEAIKTSTSNRGALWMMYAAEFIFGLGLAVPYSIGFTYVEENTVVHKSSFYAGFITTAYLSAGIVAYVLASAMLSIPENLKDNGLSQDDPEWIGAWWLGWLVQTIIAAPWVVIFLFMPAHFKNDSNVMHTYTKNKSNGTQATDSGHQPIQSVTEKKKSISIAAVIKRFFVSIWGFLLTPEYLVVLAAIILRILGQGGLFIYSNKYLEFMFNISPANASLVSIVGGVASMLGGLAVVFLTSRIKINISGTVLLLIVVYSIEGIVKVVEIFIYCPAQNYSGYISNHQIIPKASCYPGCTCSNATYDPVCSDTQVFMNPCYAGCTQNLTSCGCTSSGLAVSGPCDLGCQMLWPYVAVMAARSFLSAISEAPYMLLIIRVVDPKQDRALAFAFAFILYSIIAAVPGPILYGYAFDWSCLWSTSSCGNVGACAVYDTDRMRYVMTIPSATGAFVAVAIYIALHRMVVRKGLDKRDGEGIAAEVIEDVNKEQK